MQALEAHDLGIAQLDGRDAQVFALRDDLGDPGAAHDLAQPGDCEEQVDLGRDRTVAVHELLTHIGFLFGRGDGRDLGVDLQAQAFAAYVAVGNVGVDLQVHAHVGLFGGSVASVGGDRVGDHAHVQVEPDTLDVAGLGASQEVAGASDLKVALSDSQAGPQLSVGGDRLEALVRGLGEGLVAGVEEVRVGAFAASSHAPAQLVELGQAEGIGAVHDERVGVGDVQAGFDDGRTDQDVELVVPEVLDDGLELVLVHLAVGGAHARLGNQLGDVCCHRGDRVDAVVHVEDLPIAQELASDRGANLGVRVGADEGEDGLAFLGRGLEDRHLADAGDRHLEGTRDGGGRHGQDVDVGAQGLERLLVFDAETLLLVDDDQAELLKGDGTGQQRVRSDDQVDLARG